MEGCIQLAWQGRAWPGMQSSEQHTHSCTHGSISKRSPAGLHPASGFNDSPPLPPTCRPADQFPMAALILWHLMLAIASLVAKRSLG